MLNFIIVLSVDVIIFSYVIRSVFFIDGLKKEIEQIYVFKEKYRYLFPFDTGPAIYRNSPDNYIKGIRIWYSIMVIMLTIMVIESYKYIY
jgi:hypothetical protein